MEESQFAAGELTSQEPDALAGAVNASSIASVERQLEERLSRIREGESEQADVAERLLFWIDDKPYSAELISLWEALPTIPTTTPLPFSPSWLIGLFPLRTDIVTLVDPRPLLGSRSEAASSGERPVTQGGEQALLIGESGRLIAFVVDRIGDIVSASGSMTPPLVAEAEELGRAAEYPEGAHPHESNSQEAVMALSLSTLYEDVISKLEAWSRNA